MSCRVMAVPLMALALVSTESASLAKPPSAPVRVEVEVPPNLHPGDEVTSVLTFRALADLDRLDVSVAPDGGLDVLSKPTEATFDGVRKGEGRQFTVTIRLTDPKFGSLAVFFKTLRGTTKAAGAITVTYGNPGN